MLKNQRLPLAFALALALGSGQALALGLGSIEVKSGLNQPLVAEIPVLSSTPGEADNLRVRLASPEAFAKVGIDRPGLVAANLEFSIGENARGEPVVRVTTPGKVNDPFLSFLLEVDWGRGRLLREYTILLDPPLTTPVRTVPAATAPAAEQPSAPVESLPPPDLSTPAETPAETPAATTTEPATAAAEPAPSEPIPAEPAPSEPLPPADTAPSSSASGLPAGATYTVQNGDTLWSIAQSARSGTGADVHQMMLALLRANPDAFIGDNVNQMKRGAILRIPGDDELAAVSAADAALQIQQQMQTWREGRDTPQPVEASDAPEVADTRPTPSQDPDSRLELVPPRGDAPADAAQSGATAAGDGAELRGDLQRAREQVTALQQESRELKSRVSDLEQLDADNKRLIDLKDSELAEAQRRLAQLEAERDAALASAQTAATTTPAETPVETPVDTAAPTDTAPTDVAATDAAAADPTATDPAAVDPAATDPAAADPLATTTDPTAVDPTATDPAATDPTAVDPTAVDPNAAAPVDTTEPATTEPAPADTAPATDVAATEPAATDAPAQPWYLRPLVLGGAGIVLLALLAAVLLGRRKPAAPVPARGSVADAYAAANTSVTSTLPAVDDDDTQRLVDAIAEQPDDLSRHLALVRHYYEQSDESGFEGAAEAMYAQLFDPEDSSWKQVVQMGRDLLPDHPLFAASGLEPERIPVAEPPAAAPSFGETYPDLGRAPEPPATQRASLDWDAPAPVPTPEPARAASDTTQRFSVDQIEELAQSRREPARDDLSIEAESLEFESVTATDVDMPDVDLGELDATLAGEAPAGGDDAAATKLELARAYLDMGDVEGARGMLEEVVGEGNPGQRSEAKRLLDEIR